MSPAASEIENGKLAHEPTVNGMWLIGAMDRVLGKGKVSGPS
jgi:hypothetical protein